uniref:Uncharacterized protein n=1 Tax=Anguilla anguilla TaxID=7936 RepID=A0A0E9UJE2_ANGAN
MKGRSNFCGKQNLSWLAN